MKTYKATIQFPSHCIVIHRVTEEAVYMINKKFRKRRVGIFCMTNKDFTKSDMDFTIDFSKVIFVTFEKVKDGE